MPSSLVAELVSQLSAADSENELRSVLISSSKRLNFDHFALAYDKRGFGANEDTFLIHDYPEGWANIYLGFELARIDPVRRASERSMTGFVWKEMENFIPLTRTDRQILSVGRENGISDGYTVPRHLPGDASGSCSFMVGPEREIPRAMLPSAEIVGAVALSSARRIVGNLPPKTKPMLSERQRECVLWSARGKTAGEIGTILGISQDTVIQHLKLARERYDVHCRQALVLNALFDGLIGFSDIFERWTDQAS